MDTEKSLDTKVLIVDDEPTILETVENRLRKEGFTTFVADSAEEGMRLFRRVKPNLILLDIMLPQRSGYEFCRTVRKESPTPIIFISARNNEADRVKGLDMGADDYITKPFNLAEVTARIKAVLRRASGEPAREVLIRGNLRIDPAAHEAYKDGEKMELSPKEFALLYFFARYTGQVFSRDVLLDRVWGKDTFVSGRTVDVHIRWLRTHIEEDATRPVRLITIRGIGYKFVG